MAGESLDILDQLNFAGFCSCAANTPAEWDHQTAMPTLVGADFQQLGFSHAVKACPVKTVIAVMHLAGNGGHQGDLIGFAFGDGGNGLFQCGVINLHGNPRGKVAGGALPLR